MRRPLLSRLHTALFVVPMTLASTAALAAPGPEACNNIELVSTGQCEFEVSGGCEADCTPLNFVAACDGQCTAEAQVSCTGGCQLSCEAECEVNPPAFDCEASCTGSCNASCMASCSDSTCQAQCQASCDHRCGIECTATPPTADCHTRCAASCDASCSVQANVDCQVKCSVDIEGGCKVACQQPKGALFCGGQYVDVPGSFDDCVTYLESRGFGFSAAGSCTGASCTGSVSIGCSVAPAVGAVDERFGVGAIAGIVVGLGLFAARRRRRA